MNEHEAKHLSRVDLSPEERRREICRLLEREGSVKVDQLAERWQVQPITIRRDLEQLADQGLLIRIHGGAMRNERVRLEFSYADRMQQQLAEKKVIARYAADLVQPGQTVILDTGTTTQLLARELVQRTDLQIVTNSMVVASELHAALGLNVILLGGQARHGGFELIGPITERLLADIHADIAFLGADGIDPESGFYTADLSVARVEELMINAASKVVVTAAASKLGRRAFARYANFMQVDMWITSGRLAAAQRRRMRHKSMQIVELPTETKGSKHV